MHVRRATNPKRPSLDCREQTQHGCMHAPQSIGWKTATSCQSMEVSTDRNFHMACPWAVYLQVDSVQHPSGDDCSSSNYGCQSMPTLNTQEVPTVPHTCKGDMHFLLVYEPNCRQLCAVWRPQNGSRVMSTALKLAIRMEVALTGPAVQGYQGGP